MRAFTLGAVGTTPEFNEESDRQFADSPSWGAPSARIESASGLMNLRLWDQRDRPDVLLSLNRLFGDQVASVRYQIATRLISNRKSFTPWAKKLLDYYCGSEENQGVVTGVIPSAMRVAYYEEDRFFRLLSQVVDRFPVRKSDGRLTHCIEQAYQALCDAYIVLGNEHAEGMILALLKAPVENAEIFQVLIARYREIAVCEKVGEPDKEAEAQRRRALAWYTNVAALIVKTLQKLTTQLSEASSQEKKDEIQRDLQRCYRVIDTISLELYFISGASTDTSKAHLNVTPEQRRFFKEAMHIFRMLAQASAVHAAHHLIEALEVFISDAPETVFELIALTVKSAVKLGYAFESLAVPVMVRIVERYIADFPRVFEAKENRKDLVDILDAFVEAGWPDARKLVYRTSEIWS